MSVSMPTVVGTHARVVSCACNAYCKRLYARGQRRLHPRLLEGSHDQTQSLRSVRHRSRGFASPLCTTTGWRTNTPCAYVLRQDISRWRPWSSCHCRSTVCAAARFACRGLAIIQTRRKLARAPPCLWWCSVVRVLQYRTWPHLCCAGEHGRHQAEEWWPAAFSVDNIME